MEQLLDTLASEWAIRALLASSMVGIMCGVIGCFIVLRNMAMVGDALSHAILPGIFISFLIVGYSTVGFFIGSVVAGLCFAAFITWIQQNISTKNDAAIGIVFTAMFSIGVIGISWISETGTHLDLKDFLFGNVLGISTEDIILTAIVMVYTLLSVTIFFRYLFISTFQPTIAQTMGISVKAIHYFLMLLLSFSVVAAMRSVGVILVVAMLITPSSTALLLSSKLKNVLIVSGFLGLISAVIGMLIAIIADTAPGPAMVLLSTLIYLLVAIFAPSKGILSRYITRNNERKRIDKEDIVKYTFKQNRPVLLKELIDSLKFSERKTRSLLNSLLKNKVLSSEKQGYILSYQGRKIAEKLVRAHRLWETYQVDKMGISEDKIHDEAERYEHLLSEQLLDEVDERLGFPELDPHGSPIPKKSTPPKHSILNTPIKKKVIISAKQPSQEIESELWELKLIPESTIELINVGKEFTTVRSGRKIIKIHVDLAREIVVEH